MEILGKPSRRGNGLFFSSKRKEGVLLVTIAIHTKLLWNSNARLKTWTIWGRNNWTTIHPVHKTESPPLQTKSVPMREQVTDRERGRRTRTRQREREKASSLCSSASEKQLYYITVSGLGSSHAFKEEAHVPLHLKSRGRVGEDGDEVEAWAQRQVRREAVRDKIQNSAERFLGCMFRFWLEDRHQFIILITTRPLKYCHW